MRVHHLGLLAALVLPATLGTHAAVAAPPRTVTVATPRVHLSDVVVAAPADLADLDLGPAPPVGGSRLITKEDLQAAVGARADKLTLPAATRVTRKVKSLSAKELEKIVQRATAEQPLPKHAALVAVRPPKSFDVADGYERIELTAPKLPRRAGPLTVTVSLRFVRGDEQLGQIDLPCDLSLPKEATIPDVAQRQTLDLTIERGLVEIRTTATANVDGDVGDLIPVTLSAGKVLHARLIDKSTAEVVEESP
jgi:hypothetical protein